jgi:hypothetical protein
MARAGDDVDAVAAQSKFTLPQALTSISQPLQPPAETERSLSDRPKRFFNSAWKP